MKIFRKMDTVFIVKFHRIPRKRIGFYTVDNGVVFNTVKFTSRIKYYVQYFNDKIKAKGRTWIDSKYLFSNYDDANEFAELLNQKLEINRDAREKVKKLYED